MDVHVKLSRAEAGEKPHKQGALPRGEDLLETARLQEGTLESLFRSLTRSHPELAPILEDAPRHNDVEILVNDAPVMGEQAQDVRLQHGDRVSLFVKEP